MQFSRFLIIRLQFEKAIGASRAYRFTGCDNGNRVVAHLQHIARGMLVAAEITCSVRNVATSTEDLAASIVSLVS